MAATREVPIADGDSDRIGRLRQNLRLKVLGDETKVDSLIECERRRNPHGTLLQLMENAIDRWERDNR